jgi:hypothetical protein
MDGAKRVQGDQVEISDGPSNTAFEEWRRALQLLTSGENEAQAWRRNRYRFAHRLGEALVGMVDGGPPITGPAVYGVWLEWGLLYVGQTLEAERRLRDLAIGESHHLANTFPPEIWHRVVLIAWPLLPGAATLTPGLGQGVIGLALEHRLQSWLKPLANASQRTRSGGWREVNWQTSRSRGARHSEQIDGLFHAVQRVWMDAAGQTAGTESRTEVFRVIFPGEMLSEA